MTCNNKAKHTKFERRGRTHVAGVLYFDFGFLSSSMI